ncbi:MAG: tetratricopeptide repeat protein [Phycisphaerae bacterium]|nr:tetratricopeptide repeat protein [Phycisphaerae bacterium]
MTNQLDFRPTNGELVNRRAARLAVVFTMLAGLAIVGLGISCTENKTSPTVPATQIAIREYVRQIVAVLPKGWSVQTDKDIVVVSREKPIEIDRRGWPCSPHMSADVRFMNKAEEKAYLKAEGLISSGTYSIKIRFAPPMSEAEAVRLSQENRETEERYYRKHPVSVSKTPRKPLAPPKELTAALHPIPDILNSKCSIFLHISIRESRAFYNKSDEVECRKVERAVLGILKDNGTQGRKSPAAKPGGNSEHIKLQVQKVEKEIQAYIKELEAGSNSGYGAWLKGRKAIMPLLIPQLLASSNRHVKHEAMIMVRDAYGCKEFVPHVIVVLDNLLKKPQDTEAFTRIVACQVLGKWVDFRSVPLLLKALEDKYKYHRMVAAPPGCGGAEHIYRTVWWEADEALRSITGASPIPKPYTTGRSEEKHRKATLAAWRKWWQENKDKFPNPATLPGKRSAAENTKARLIFQKGKLLRDVWNKERFAARERRDDTPLMQEERKKHLPKAKKAFNQAVAAFKEVRALYPQSELAAEAVFYLSDLYEKSRMYEECIQTCEELLNKYPKAQLSGIVGKWHQFNTYRRLGDAYAGLRRREKAIEAYVRSLLSAEVARYWCSGAKHLLQYEVRMARRNVIVVLPKQLRAELDKARKDANVHITLALDMPMEKPNEPIRLNYKIHNRTRKPIRDFRLVFYLLGDNRPASACWRPPGRRAGQSDKLAVPAGKIVRGTITIRLQRTGLAGPRVVLTEMELIVGQADIGKTPPPKWTQLYWSDPLWLSGEGATCLPTSPLPRLTK